jgi:hypothetical protein
LRDLLRHGLCHDEPGVDPTGLLQVDLELGILPVSDLGGRKQGREE